MSFVARNNNSPTNKTPVRKITRNSTLLLHLSAGLRVANNSINRVDIVATAIPRVYTYVYRFI